MLDNLSDRILSEFNTLSFPEVIAVILGLVYLFLAGAGNRYAWIFGGFSSMLYVGVFAISGLWFNAVLNGVYVLTAIWGWVSWSGYNPLNLVCKPFFLWLITALLFVIFALTGRCLHTTLPFADAAVSAVSLTATYLLIHRNRSAWLVWSVVNSAAVFLFLYSNLWFTSFLYFFYSLYSVFCYFRSED
jgi:nicotinamide mononucleotide transporter